MRREIKKGMDKEMERGMGRGIGKEIEIEMGSVMGKVYLVGCSTRGYHFATISSADKTSHRSTRGCVMYPVH